MKPIEAYGRTVQDELDGFAGDFRMKLAANAFSSGFKGGMEVHEDPFAGLVNECKRLLVEGDIALKLFDLFLAKRPLNLSNEFRRELIATAIELEIDPQDLLDMVSKRADRKKAEVFKIYSPEESKSGSRQGERKKRS